MSDNMFSYGLANLPLMIEAKTRSVCAENPKGAPGMGGRSTDGEAADHAAHLGQGWKISPYYTIASGEERLLADIEGPGILQSMWFASGAARQIILRIYWEEQQLPSVECPLMEFFAYSWHKMNPDKEKGPFFQLSSIPVAVNPNRGFNCFWPMPFRKRCRVSVENRSSSSYKCYYQINYSLQQIPEDMAYFHARFHRTNPVPYKKDFTIIDEIQGRGQYVGTALFVGLNSAGNWWGEGEIKFFIDDDTQFPTVCGTGTEDYFGGAYAWVVDGAYHTYTTPYMGVHQLIQPDGLFGCQQRFSMYRWHIMDPIRFEKKLRVTIQDLGWETPGGKYLSRMDDMAAVAYWYQTLPTAPFARILNDCEIMFV